MNRKINKRKNKTKKSGIIMEFSKVDKKKMTCQGDRKNMHKNNNIIQKIDRNSQLELTEKIEILIIRGCNINQASIIKHGSNCFL